MPTRRKPLVSGKVPFDMTLYAWVKHLHNQTRTHFSLTKKANPILAEVPRELAEFLVEDCNYVLDEASFSERQDAQPTLNVIQGGQAHRSA